MQKHVMLVYSDPSPGREVPGMNMSDAINTKTARMVGASAVSDLVEG
jgi:hypothetical protein